MSDVNKSYSTLGNHVSVQSAPPASDDDEIDLLELLGTLWRGKLVLAGAAILALLIGGFYAFGVAVPRYTATATVAIEMQAPSIVDIESVVSGVSTEDASLNTELEILQSRTVILNLIDTMDLLEDPEFNASLRPEPAISLAPVIGLVRSLIGSSGEATASEVDEETAILNSTVDAVRSAISASIKRDTFVFNVSATTTGRVKSQRW